MEHPQPKTPVHCDNAMAVGIASNTVKGQHGNEIFLGRRQGGTRNVQHHMATGNGKSGRLPEQTPYRIAPCGSLTILFAPRKLTKNITACNKT